VTDNPLTENPESHSHIAEPEALPDDAIVVVAVNEAGELDASPDSGASDGLEEPLSLDPDVLSQTLSDLQTELAGTAGTGVASVDAALARLADIDPTDLAASADILADVLRRLEGALEESPEG